MSDYTPSEARVCIDFCNAATKRPRTDGSFMTIDEADAAFSRWLATHDAEVRAEERERAALHAEEGYRMEEHCDDIAKRIRSGEPAEIAARPGVVAEEPEAPRQRGIVFVPQPIRQPQRPAVSPQDYPLGTRWMRRDDSLWEVEWDDQDKRHMWVPVKQESS